MNRPVRSSAWGLAAGVLAVVLMLLASVAFPAEAQAIPESSALYRLQLERETARQFGLDAPVARIAAQIHQESGWRPTAQSPFAQGLAQFTPATAKWLPQVCPEVGPPDPWDSRWSLRAITCYDAWLHRRVRAQPAGRSLDECSRWAYTLRAYNGGEGWLNRERSKAAAAGANANDWRQVEQYRVRAGWAHKENIGYPRRILLVLEPRYLRAGWPGKAACG